MLKRSDLDDYQVEFGEFIHEKKKCGLFLGMGSGKTVISLTAASDFLDDFFIQKVLIIAPLRVANTVWKQEAAQWEHLKHLKVRICTGTEEERRSALRSNSDVYVINRENIPWLVENVKWEWDMVIVDESTSFKNPSSKRFRALRKVIKHMKSVVLLTGTPIPKGVIDLWSQIFLIDNGERLGRNITVYRNRFFRQDYCGFGYTPLEGSDEKIKELISDICVSRKAVNDVDMTPLYEYIEMPDKIKKQYKELEKEFLLDLENGGNIEAPTSAALSGKLLQMCNGAIYDADKKTHLIHDLKIKVMKELMEDNPGENFLVGYNFKHDLARLKKAFPKLKMLSKSGKEVEPWNRGEIELLATHPACLHPSTEVLTELRGWVKIVDVKYGEKVFDGIEFVSHSGCHFSGLKSVINKFGITLTSNHKLLINNKWVEAKDVSNSKKTRKEACYTYEGDDDYLGEMLSLRGGGRGVTSKCDEGESSKEEILSTLYRRNLSQDDEHENMEDLARHDTEDNKRICSKLHSLWWERYFRIERMVKFRKFLSGHVGRLQRASFYRSYRQLKRLLKRKLQMGHRHGTTGKQTKQQISGIQRGGNASGRILQENRCGKRGDITKTQHRDESGRSFGGLQKFDIPQESKISKVYDLVDCGPRNSFLIRNSQGEIFISHNSGGHGLNIQDGGCVLIWFGMNWSLELYEQLNTRLFRRGQKNNVRVIHIIMKGGIDERVLKALESGAETQDELMAYLKFNLKSEIK